jgi:hypothetical protein
MFERLKTAGLTAAAVIFSVACPALADVTMECEIKQLGNNGVWLPEVVIVAHDGDTGNAVVFDPLIEHFYGDPLPAKIETDNARRTTYVWELKTKTSSNQDVRFKYRLTIQKADLSAAMSGVPLGYGETFQAQGKCKRVNL